jgi:hypothetical protein
MMTLNLTLKEAFMIGTVIVSVTTSYVLMQQDVQQLKTDVKEMRVELDTVQSSVMKQNTMLNFLMGEGVKYGWTVPNNWFDSLKDEIALKPWRKTNAALTTAE